LKQIATKTEEIQHLLSAGEIPAKYVLARLQQLLDERPALPNFSINCSKRLGRPWRNCISPDGQPKKVFRGKFNTRQLPTVELLPLQILGKDGEPLPFADLEAQLEGRTLLPVHILDFLLYESLNDNRRPFLIPEDWQEYNILFWSPVFLDEKKENCGNRGTYVRYLYWGERTLYLDFSEETYCDWYEGEFWFDLEMRAVYNSEAEEENFAVAVLPAS
jgi:hypothetical protein